MHPCSGDRPPGTGASGDCHLSAYKLHHHDHVMFSRGFSLFWRNGEPGSSDLHKCGHVDKTPPNCSQSSAYDCATVTKLVTDVFYYSMET